MMTHTPDEVKELAQSILDGDFVHGRDAGFKIKQIEFLQALSSGTVRIVDAVEKPVAWDYPIHVHNIRGFTHNAEAAKTLADEGVEVRPLYASPPPAASLVDERGIAEERKERRHQELIKAIKQGANHV